MYRVRTHLDKTPPSSSQFLVYPLDFLAIPNNMNKTYQQFMLKSIYYISIFGIVIEVYSL